MVDHDKRILLPFCCLFSHFLLLLCTSTVPAGSSHVYGLFRLVSGSVGHRRDIFCVWSVMLRRARYHYPEIRSFLRLHPWSVWRFFGFYSVRPSTLKLQKFIYLLNTIISQFTKWNSIQNVRLYASSLITHRIIYFTSVHFDDYGL